MTSTSADEISATDGYSALTVNTKATVPSVPSTMILLNSATPSAGGNGIVKSPLNVPTSPSANRMVTVDGSAAKPTTSIFKPSWSSITTWNGSKKAVFSIINLVGSAINDNVVGVLYSTGSAALSRAS